MPLARVRWGGRGHQSVVKDQQLGAVIEGDIPLERTLGAVEIGQSRPARTGGRAAGDGDAGEAEAVGQQLAGIEHLAAATGHNPVAAIGLAELSEAPEVGFAAVELQFRTGHPQTVLL